MPSLEEFCRITATMDMNVIGKTPAGMRLDFPFSGSAAGPFWEGERPVNGVDYVTVRSDGHMDLDIHGTIGDGRQQVAYRATGVSLAGEERGTAHPQELLTFQTADEDLAWLNERVGIALGTGVGSDLTLTVYLVSRD